MAEYRAKTAPILPFYDAKGIVRRVDGMADMDHVGAESADHAEPVKAGQHAVSDDEIEDALASKEQPVTAVGSDLHRMASLDQPLGEVSGSGRVVLDDQNLAAHGSSLANRRMGKAGGKRPFRRPYGTPGSVGHRSL